jgi:signal transduction histidine kinase
MSLQRKFIALLMVLAFAVILNIVAALWTLKFVQRELVRPLADMQLILPNLGRIKQGITAQASLLGGGAEGFPLPQSPSPPDPATVRDAFERAALTITNTIHNLEHSDQYQSLVGISTTRNLHTRINQSQALARQWLASHADADRSDAINQFVEAYDLIEKMEAKVTESAASASVDTYAPLIERSLLVVMFASLIIVALSSVLGVILVRRWVTRPVGLLREAADRLARGEFTYRVPVTTQDELGKLSAEVNHMAGMISTMQEERVERERLAAAGEVVRRLAHNLRNPLAGIRSLAELSRAELRESDPARDNQSRIVQTVDRFERWLADVLSATTPLKLTPESIPVAPWVNAVVEPLRPSASTRNVRLDVDITDAPGLAIFDPRHLEQAFVGIITNAIQASPRGAAVLVAARANGDTWEFSVTDRGQGVAAELLDKIFRPYFTTKRDGTGIGLAVAKQVAEQHAGRIWVEPGFGEPGTADSGPGARFVVKLPLAGPPDVANTGQSGPGDGARFGQDSHSRG